MKKILFYICILFFMTVRCNSPEFVPAPSCGSEDVKVPAGWKATKLGSIPITKYGYISQLTFTSDSIGYALRGDKLDVWKTTNRGKTWEQLPTNTPKYIHGNGMAFFNEKIGIILTYNFKNPSISSIEESITITKDGGKTWQLIEYPQSQGTLLYPKFDKKGTLFATNRISESAPDILVKSTDLGITWTSVSESFDFGYFNFSLDTDSLFVSSGKMLLQMTKNGVVLKSISTSDEVEKAFNYPSPLTVLNENEIFYGAKTKNGGSVWDRIYSPSYNRTRIMGIENIDEYLVLEDLGQTPQTEKGCSLVGCSKIGLTSDGGISWQYGEVFKNDGYWAAQMSDHSYICVFGGDIWEIRKQ